MAPIDKKRILVMTSSFPSSDVNQNIPGFVRELCENFSQYGFIVDVLAPYQDGSKLQERFGEVTVYRYRYALPSMHSLTNQKNGILSTLKERRLSIFWVPFMFFSLFWTAKKMFKNNNYDLIHAHWIIPQGWVAVKLLQHLKMKTPLVTTSHGADLYTLKSSFWQSVKNKVLKQSTHVSVVNNAMKQYCMQQFNIAASQISVINRGVDLERLFYRLPCVQRQSDTLLFVGELSEQKGLKQLIQALPTISQSFADLKLYIIGEGPEETNLKKEVKAYGCEHRVFFVGAQAAPTVALYLNKAQLLVVPPLPATELGLETLQTICIEAMGCRCPVVASSVDTLKDIITDNKTGLIFKAGQAQDLAKKVIWALNHPKEMETITEQAYEFARTNFAMKQVSERYAKLLERFL